MLDYGANQRTSWRNARACHCVRCDNVFIPRSPARAADYSRRSGHYELNVAFLNAKREPRLRVARFCNMQRKETLHPTSIPTGKTKSGMCARDRIASFVLEYGGFGCCCASDVSAVRPHEMRKILIYTPRDQTGALISSGRRRNFG